ncbi:nicotinamide mononucleotide transporter [Flavisolibacter sp. BT320]|nr:nicotinamide mononucleotide transporter [Flavisolibacter longurius]
MQEIVDQFFQNLQATTPLEYIAVFTGIISVLFSRIENIWVYPTGLINTVIYIYLSFKYHLIGEASVNFYYTVMSIYGWWLWTRKDRKDKPVLQVTFSSRKEWGQEIGFFLFFYGAIFSALTFLKQNFFEGVIPWADALASASAFTGMWLMAKKKVESWWWWIVTNIASIPLYFVKGLVFTSVYYGVLLVLAVFGLLEWQRRAREKNSVI